MSDTFTPEARHHCMSRIRSKDTTPELMVRRWLFANGYRFRLHRKDLPGKPDIVLPKYRTAIFINGCFWHHHENCRYGYMPKSNLEYWESKFRKNKERDEKNLAELTALSWRVLIIWECQIKNGTFAEVLSEKLNSKWAP